MCRVRRIHSPRSEEHEEPDQFRPGEVAMCRTAEKGSACFQRGDLLESGRLRRVQFVPVVVRNGKCWRTQGPRIPHVSAKTNGRGKERLYSLFLGRCVRGHLS